MARQLAERNPQPSPESAPVWGWYQYGGTTRPRPDLRPSAHLPPGTRGVRLELSLPSSEVLLSDFMLWHNILNDGDIPVRGRPGKNWDKVFDLEYYERDVAYARDDKTIQAVFWRAPISAVRTVDFFVAR